MKVSDIEIGQTYKAGSYGYKVTVTGDPRRDRYSKTKFLWPVRMESPTGSVKEHMLPSRDIHRVWNADDERQWQIEIMRMKKLREIEDLLTAAGFPAEFVRDLGHGTRPMEIYVGWRREDALKVIEALTGQPVELPIAEPITETVYE